MIVKLARIKKGLTQAQLCKLIKMSPSKLVEIERGHTDTITLRHMKKIAEVLDSTIEELFLQDEEGERK